VLILLIGISIPAYTFSSDEIDETLCRTMEDSGNDGWNGAIWEITDLTTLLIIDSGTLTFGSTGFAFTTLPMGCYSITVGGGTADQEITWTLGETDAGELSGGAPDSQNFTIEGGGDCYACIDPVACNYSDLAILDDGSCCSDYCVILNIIGGNSSTSWSIRDEVLDELVFFGNDEPAYVLMCLPQGCYSFSTMSSTPVILSGTDQGELVGFWDDIEWEFTLGNPSCSGCHDLNACNYDPSSAVGVGLCSYPGCMDPVACNYDSLAYCSSSSCVYNSESCSQACIDPVGFGKDFTGYFNPTNWIGTVSNTFQNEIVQSTGSIAIHSIDLGLEWEFTTRTDVQVQNSGSISFQWFFWMDFASNGYDQAIYFQDGDPIELTNGYIPNLQTGSAMFQVFDGDTIGFGIIRDSGSDSQGHLLITDFQYSTEICGCMYADANNYNPQATVDDGSCLYANNCSSDLTGDGTINTADLLEFLSNYGTDCPE
jgi:hypothetical protein